MNFPMFEEKSVVSELSREENPDSGKMMRYFAVCLIIIILLLIVILTSYLIWVYSGGTGQLYEYIDDGWLLINIIITIISFAIIWYKWHDSVESKIDRIIDNQKESFQTQNEHLNLGHKTYDMLSTIFNDTKLNSKSYLSQYMEATNQVQMSSQKLIGELAELVLMDMNQLRTYFSNHGAEEIYKYCSLWYQSGDFSKSVDGFTIILERDSHHVSALNDRGSANLTLGNYKAGLDDLLRARDRDSNSSVILNNLGLAYWNLNDVTMAERVYHEGLTKSPVFFGVYTNLSTLLRRTNRLDKAHNIAQMGVKMFPSNSNLRAELGRVLIEKNEYELAEKELKQAIQDDESNAWAYANLALLYSKRELIPDAIRYYEKAVELETNSEFTHNLAVLHAKSNHITEADKWFRRTLLIAPDNIDSTFQFSAFLVTQGQLDEAIGLAKRIYEDNEDYPNIRTFYAICLALSRNLDKMTDVLGLAPSECPDNEDILEAVILGIISDGEFRIFTHQTEEQKIPLEENKAKILIPYLRKILDLNPSNIETRMLLIKCLWQTKDYHSALGIVESGLIMDSDHIDMLVIRTSLLIRLDQRDDAFQLLESLVRELPNNPVVVGNYGSTLRTRGEFNRSEAHLKQALLELPGDEFYLNELHLLERENEERERIKNS